MKKTAYIKILMLTALVALIVHPSVGAEEVKFAPGDLIINNYKTTVLSELRLYRGNKQIASWDIGFRWRICAGDKTDLWAGFVNGQKLSLRNYYSTEKYEEYSSDPIAKLVAIYKVLRLEDFLYILYGISYQEEIRGNTINGEAIYLMPFSLSTKTFGTPLPLKDYNKRAEILIKADEFKKFKQLPAERRESPTHEIFDATFLGKNQLWISSQSRLFCYPFGKVDQELGDLFSQTETNEVPRSKTILFVESNHGNNYGIAPFSDTELLVVDMNKPGRLTAVNTENPKASYTFTAAIDPEDAQGWGFNFVLVLKDEILVANSHLEVRKIYRIDKKTGEVKGLFTSGIRAGEMVEVK